MDFILKMVVFTLKMQVSLSACEEFEGVEPAVNWAGAERFWKAWRGGRETGTTEALSAAGSRFNGCEIPSSRCVRHIYDRVVVRPATANATLRDVLTGTLPRGAIAAYLLRGTLRFMKSTNLPLSFGLCL